MRKVSANLVFPVSSPPLRNGIIIFDDTGMVTELIDTKGNLHEERGLEYYQGWIVPGFVIPWLQLDNTCWEGDLMKRLDRELFHNGIRGVGLVIAAAGLSDEVLDTMQGSPVKYHPVIELCPPKETDEYATFNHGVDLVSHAWNEYHITCSLEACSHPDCLGLKSYPGLAGYIKEYSASHNNVHPVKGHSISPGNEDASNSSVHGSFFPLNIFRQMELLYPIRHFESLLSEFTLEASRRIFEDDELGSVEPGKRPGLNLISGFLPHSGEMQGQSGMDPGLEIQIMAEKASVKVLI
jgi:hypothetical protein